MTIQEKYMKLMKAHKKLQKQYAKALDIASEALVLADAYAMGESVAVEALNERFEKLEN